MWKLTDAILLHTIYLACMTILVECKPTTNQTVTSTSTPTANASFAIGNVIDHLVKYGYLSERNAPRTNRNVNTTTSTYTDKELQDALKDYQTFMQLPVTGTVDEKTLKNMNKTRCGVKDKTPNFRMKMVLTSSGKRKRRQALKNQFSNTRTEIWYFVNPRPKYGKIDSVYHQLEYAFNMWAGVSNIVFIRGDGIIQRSDLLIGFYSGTHGDGEDFDGIGGVIAHASAALKVIHFDSDEAWSWHKNGDQFRWLHPDKGSDFIQCAMHELGHVLGFSHIDEKVSAMHPNLQKFQYLSEYSLSNTDIARVQASYGKCDPPRFDAIFTNTWRDGRTYILIGAYIYQFNDKEKTVEQTWPRATVLHWSGSPMPDEVFWNTDYFLYWFAGDEYYAYSTSQDYPTYRAKIGLSNKTGRVGWTGLREPRVDAAMSITQGLQEHSYIFRKDLVYRMKMYPEWDRMQLPYQKVEPGWPKKISEVFPGIRNDLDTAFQWGYDSNVYFFKGKYFQIWDPNSEYNTRILYGIHQWQHVCDVYKCQIGEVKDFYKCESWAFTLTDCSLCGPITT